MPGLLTRRHVRFVQRLRFLYLETVENRGENYKELPKRDEYRVRLPKGFDVLMYRERPAGPVGSDRATVRMLARKWTTQPRVDALPT